MEYKVNNLEELYDLENTLLILWAEGQVHYETSYSYPIFINTYSIKGDVRLVVFPHNKTNNYISWKVYQRQRKLERLCQ